MVTDIREVEQYLAELPVPNRDYSDRLKTVKEALSLLGNPQDTIPAIHIAGTSGKGSTAYYTSALLHAAGYSVGLAVSPHVNSVAERSQVNGAPLPDDEYCTYFNQFIAIVDDHKWTLSYIEFLTTFTYWLFAELQLDYMAIEVGMGGRLDPTNTITRSDTVRVITDIGFDHVEILGDTLAKIAREKAGIIHAHNTVVMHPQDADVMRVVKDVCRTKDAKLIIEPSATVDDSSLPAFQQRNWTLARRAVSVRLSLDGRKAISENAVADSLSTTIPGRFELFMKSSVPIILDAAHNPQKLTALVTSLTAKYPNKQAVFVVAFGANKQSSLEHDLQILYSIAHHTIATSFTATVQSSQSNIPLELIKDTAKSLGFSADSVRVISDPYQALDEAVALAQDSDAIVVVTGSFYLIDGIRLSLLSV